MHGEAKRESREMHPSTPERSQVADTSKLTLKRSQIPNWKEVQTISTIPNWNLFRVSLLAPATWDLAENWIK